MYTHIRQARTVLEVRASVRRKWQQSEQKMTRKEVATGVRKSARCNQ